MLWLGACVPAQVRLRYLKQICQHNGVSVQKPDSGDVPPSVEGQRGSSVCTPSLRMAHPTLYCLPCNPSPSLMNVTPSLVIPPTLVSGALQGVHAPGLCAELPWAQGPCNPSTATPLATAFARPTRSLRVRCSGCSPTTNRRSLREPSALSWSQPGAKLHLKPSSDCRRVLPNLAARRSAVVIYSLTRPSHPRPVAPPPPLPGEKQRRVPM